MIECFGISKQAFYKWLKSYEIKLNQEQILLELARKYRNQIGQRTGGFA
ncbi:MAG: hypothetical protein IZT56_14145 [Bacteroidetes bacterium]|nr:hypothetical protein [Bacteroidota bacterium]